MANPINYIIDTPDPLAEVMRGFEAGTAIRRQPLLEQREAEDRARLGVVQGQEDQTFANQQTLFAQGQEDRVALQAQLAEQQAQARAMRAEMVRIGSDPNASADDYINFMIDFPAASEEMKGIWELKDEANRASEFRTLGEAYSSLSLGDPESAIKLLTDRAEALRNSGQIEEADKMKPILEILNSGDMGAAREGLSFAMAAVEPEKFKEVYETIGNQRRLSDAEAWTEETRIIEIKQMAADLGLTEAQTNRVLVDTREMNEEAARAAAEFAALEAAGGRTPSDIFDMEDKLRKQYVARVGTFPEAVTQYDKLLASANIPNPETGAGDVALVFSFMKMLDPGSVVRESEFALAQNTGGLLTRLQNTLTKAERGEFMTPTQRREMVALAKQFMDAAQAQADRVQADLMIPVRNNNLSAENVFGTAGQEATQPGPTPDQEADAFFGAGN